MYIIEKIADAVVRLGQSDIGMSVGNFFAVNGWIFPVGMFILFAAIGLASVKKIREAAKLIKSGFKGVSSVHATLVNPSAENDNQPQLRILGINCNGIKVGNMLSFDKDPFQTILFVKSMKQMLNQEYLNSHKGNYAPAITLKRFLFILEAKNPTDIPRLATVSAIGQPNRTVLKAKNLKLVLR